MRINGVRPSEFTATRPAFEPGGAMFGTVPTKMRFVTIFRHRYRHSARFARHRVWISAAQTVQSTLFETEKAIYFLHPFWRVQS
jgi:hypothetical protein